MTSLSYDRCTAAGIIMEMTYSRVNRNVHGPSRVTYGPSISQTRVRAIISPAVRIFDHALVRFAANESIDGSAGSVCRRRIRNDND